MGRSEESNGQTVKGHYTYIMADGQKRRVDYIADNQGFHILRDDADITNRIKREADAAVESDLIRTRMTAVMDSTSLMDDNQDMYSANNMMGSDMTSNMMGHNIGKTMIGQNMYSKMMGRDMDNTFMRGHGMSSNT